MAMALRSFVAVALLAVVVAEDIPQLPATALEALPQSFWDNFVYCKCGLSCAEKDGSIGKARPSRTRNKCNVVLGYM